MGWKDIAHGKAEARNEKPVSTDKDTTLGAQQVISRNSKKSGGAVRWIGQLLFTVPVGASPFAFYKAGDYCNVCDASVDGAKHEHATIAMLAYGPVGQWVGRARMRSFASYLSELESADAILAGLQQAVAKSK